MFASMLLARPVSLRNSSMTRAPSSSIFAISSVLPARPVVSSFMFFIVPAPSDSIVSMSSVLPASDVVSTCTSSTTPALSVRILSISSVLSASTEVSLRTSSTAPAPSLNSLSISPLLSDNAPVVFSIFSKILPMRCWFSGPSNFSSMAMTSMARFSISGAASKIAASSDGRDLMTGRRWPACAFSAAAAWVPPVSWI